MPLLVSGELECRSCFPRSAFIHLWKAGTDFSSPPLMLPFKNSVLIARKILWQWACPGLPAASSPVITVIDALNLLKGGARRPRPRLVCVCWSHSSACLFALWFQIIQFEVIYRTKSMGTESWLVSSGARKPIVLSFLLACSEKVPNSHLVTWEQWPGSTCPSPSTYLLIPFL